MQEAVCIFIFTIEFVARMCVCPSLSLFVFNFLNIVDAISIIPWYVEKALFANLSLNSAVFRSLRLIRVFRLLKVSRYLTFMNSLAEAMLQSIQPLYILLFIILIGLLIFSSAVYYAERGVAQSGTGAGQFGSIIQSMWWCVATITTVGYGAHGFRVFSWNFCRCQECFSCFCCANVHISALIFRALLLGIRFAPICVICFTQATSCPPLTLAS